LPGCYTFSVVEYVKLGRKLGRGTRIAARVLHGQAQGAVVAARAKAPAIQAQGRTLTRAGRGFGQGFWKPFAKAVRALWHEVTGLFFGLFALFFGQGLWRVRYAWASGPEHRHFEVYLVVTLLFGYFSLSSFVRSRRHSR
jgi:hypothetical protein